MTDPELDRDRGMARLRIALSSIESATSPITSAAYVARTRPIRDLDGLEQALLVLLADTNDALRHLRTMQLYRERFDAPS